MSEIAFCARNQTFRLRPLRGLVHPGSELSFVALVGLVDVEDARIPAL
jgi:hypothetical protein